MQKLTLRLPDDLNDKLKEAADRDDRSVNSYLVALIRRTVDPEETPGARRKSG
ncbi:MULTISPECIES: Arc family DNA-binding protein [unclassified Nocardiopsis]|uniref:Arc family DNA-binding protein n=1 Tax=Nocardiopsis TaxID=2013 RepID=UPI00387B71A7